MQKNTKNKAFIYVLLLCLLYVGGQQRVWGQGYDDYSKEAFEYRERVSQAPPRTSLEERVKAATTVVEGKIVARNAVQTPEGTYRVYVTVAVYKIFKGKGIKDTIVIVGNENYKSEKDATSFGFAGYLEPADENWVGSKSITPGIGFFFVKQLNVTVKIDTTKPIFQFIQDWNGIYTTDQKFAIVLGKLEDNKRYIVDYDDYKKNRRVSINTDLIEKDIYKELQQRVGKKYKTVLKKKVISSYKNSSSTLPNITGYSPQILPAGILTGNQSVLTINGSGFGTHGKIIF